MNIRAKDVLNLPIPERIKLVADIWDSIAASPEQLDVTAETRELLEQRLKAYRENPGATSDWQEVRERIEKSGRR